ncbi:unnamed protein product [Rotaria socialis]|uniref:Uncharacterized protein n=3 Tax=Rotaria socialis TaxID=392032 RepID=A0A818BMY0_9BILA|nr:unnamed protein product [Rotaria socialis]CAF3417137.1 unnamed protein product [Rotaria socialis]CAF4394683.1 unnamed protein product [Rotaria socialis]CAF4502770.1 unnamed protein product [Rotaria socialis]
MPSKKKGARMNRSIRAFRRISGLRLTDLLKFISSLLLPLSFGVFTIIITFQQQSAAKQQRDEDRNASQLQREQERDLDEQRYRNKIFGVYIKEMGQLLKENHRAMISKEFMATLSRVNTLNIFRQLDGQRNIRIIRFLYEAKQLSEVKEHSPLDLSTAKLLDIDFRDLAVDEKRLNQLSLAGIFLTNITFVGIEMTHVNFSHNHFDTANFLLVQLRNTNFSFTRVSNSNFSSSVIFNTTFAHGQLKKINFSSSQLDTVNLSLTKIDNVNFSFGNILNINFKFSSFQNVSFSSSIFYNVDFSSASLSDVDFSLSLMNNVDFSFALLVNVNFSYGQLMNVNFLSAKLLNVNFFSTKLSHPQFLSTQITNSDLSLAILASANFRGAKVFYTNFQQTTCVAANFHSSVILNSTFWYSNLKRASFAGVHLTNVNFSRANLHETSFLDVTFTGFDLLTALSIRDAQLSYDTNLIDDDQTDCNTALVNSWTLQTSYVITMMSEKNNSNCRLILKSLTTGATILRRVSLVNRWDSRSWPYSKAILSANMSIGVFIELRGTNSDGIVLAQRTLNSTKMSASLMLQDDIQELQVSIEFHAFNNQSGVTNYWCDDINLFIIYGTYLEFLRVLPHIPENARWTQNGTTVAGGHGFGDTSNQLAIPCSLFVDDNQTLFIVDHGNSRIIRWKLHDKEGQVVASDYTEGNGLNSLQYPSDVLLDKETDSLIICDQYNQQVLQLSLRDNTTQGEIILDKIDCYGLAMSDHRFLYVSDNVKHEVRRYLLGHKNGMLVAGGREEGDRLDQLNEPTFIFVDRQQAVYVSDKNNHRVMKWDRDANEGIVVAGGQGEGSALTQLANPRGLFVDSLDRLYVADTDNDRVMRWPKGATQGTVIMGGNGVGDKENQFDGPWGLSYDRHVLSSDSDTSIHENELTTQAATTIRNQTNSLISNINRTGSNELYVSSQDNLSHEQLESSSTLLNANNVTTALTDINEINSNTFSF